MKKRIIAAVLAALLLFCIGGENTRARAVAPTTVIGVIGGGAWTLLNLITGKMDGAAEAIGYILESGAESLSDVESWAIAQYGAHQFEMLFDGWNVICNTVTGWFESGDITLDGTVVTMSYSQYLELCELVGMSRAEFNIDLGSSIEHYVIPYQLNTALDIQSAPHVSTWRSPGAAMSYVPVFYSENDIYMSSTFMSLSTYLTDGGSRYQQMSMVFTKLVDDHPSRYTTGGNGVEGFSSKVTDFNDFLSEGKYLISLADDYSTIDYQYYYFFGGRISTDAVSVREWFHFDGTEMAVAESYDFTDYSFGFLNVSGLYEEFVADVTAYSAAAVPAEVDDLSDVLEPLLDIEADPVLEIETDPAIAADPVSAVTVSDIPLADLYEETRLDIDIPSVLIEKFPFCIPFDFIRILSVLAAEPVPPVFRIPISTDPEILEPFEGNQTIGELPEDFVPMFEIDEEIVIDLSGLPLVQPICHTVFIIGFVILLIYLTPKMINH